MANVKQIKTLGHEWPESSNDFALSKVSHVILGGWKLIRDWMTEK